jgi:hypothetical protein
MSDVLSVLNSIGYVTLVDSGDVWRAKPLYRDSDNPTVLCIRKSNGQWYDHAERIGGGLAQLVQKTLNLPSIRDTKNYIGDLPISISNSESIELCDTKKFDKELLIKLLKDNSYWKKRGISDHILNQFRGGVAQNGRMKGRYVFPIFSDREDLIGFAGRLLQNNDSLPKWKILGQKKDFIFPTNASEEIKKTNSVILVESIGDCLKMMECGINNVLVSFGVSLSAKIIQHLLRLDAGRIIISLNNDEYNSFVGNKASLEYKEKLLNYFDESQVTIALPTAKDFGEMSCEEIYSWKKQYLN